MAYVNATSAELGKLLRKASSTDDSVALIDLTQQEDELSRHLYYLLVMKVKSTALDKVITSGEGEGLEAWRTLFKHYEPRTPQTSTAKLLELMTWDFTGNLVDKIAKFHRAKARYQQAASKSFPDEIAIATLMRQIPERATKNHFVLNADKYST